MEKELNRKIPQKNTLNQWAEELSKEEAKKLLDYLNQRKNISDAKNEQASITY